MCLYIHLYTFYAYPLRFSVASTPGLATTPEDAVPVLEDYPSSGFDERSSFSAVPCEVCLHVAFK